MKFVHLSVTLFILFISTLNAQEIKSIDSHQLELLLQSNNDTVYVLNFWATWCSPCVKEIPYFKALQSTYSNSNLQVILINLDFPNQVESRVIPFLEKNCQGLRTYNMTNMDYNSWIPLVDDKWSGAIPATLIFRGSKKQFIEGEITQEQLNKEVKEISVIDSID